MSVDLVSVSGRNMEIGEALPAFVEQQMILLSEKYFGRLVSCRVVFSKGKSIARTCTIQLTVGRDMHFAARGESDDVQQCFRQAYEHLAKQVRRLKRAKHEDKPDGQKDKALDAMMKPDDIRPPLIDGDDLSVVEVNSDETSKAVGRMYGHD